MPHVHTWRGGTTLDFSGPSKTTNSAREVLDAAHPWSMPRRVSHLELKKKTLLHSLSSRVNGLSLKTPSAMEKCTKRKLNRRVCIDSTASAFALLWSGPRFEEKPSCTLSVSQKWKNDPIRIYLHRFGKTRGRVDPQPPLLLLDLPSV